MKIGIFGNCQTESYEFAIRQIVDLVDVYSTPANNDTSILKYCDAVLFQTAYEALLSSAPDLNEIPRSKIVFIPTFQCSYLFPDCISEKQKNGKYLRSAWGVLNSSIVLYGFLNGWSIKQTLQAFNRDVFSLLNFDEHLKAEERYFVEDLAKCGLEGRQLFQELLTQKWAYTLNHPKIDVVAKVLEPILRNLSLNIRVPAGRMGDPLVIHGEWPLYPGIAPDVDAVHNFEFYCGPPKPGTMIKTPVALDDFVERSFSAYRAVGAANIHSERLKTQAAVYGKIASTFPKPARRKRSHPYSDLPAASYWRRAVSAVAVETLDPVCATKFVLADTDRIATAGSCFAQHIAKTLVKSGNNFLVVEPPPPGMDSETAQRRNFGLFSARYGNIYTARQLLQLIRRALGSFVPLDHAWQREDGRFVDPFRPQIEPEGFGSAEEVIAATKKHLLSVRTLLEQMNVLIFTLGLTEAWEALADGAVFPVAPGVAAGEMDPGKYRFKNFTIDEVRADLKQTIDLLLSINKNLRVILTVSPVPLVATFEDRHVLVSTVHSKSILLTAAHEISQAYEAVDYFPSYELIASNYNEGRYFEEDRRSIKQEGVDHVMRIFRRHYLGDRNQAQSEPRREEAFAKILAQETKRNASVLCDEELLDKFAALQEGREALDQATEDPLFHERVLGKDGWIFLGNLHQREIDQVRGEYELAEGHVDKYIKTLAIMQRFAGRRGASLAFCIGPSKAGVYADKLPYPVSGNRKPSVCDQILSAAQRANVPIVDFRQELATARVHAETFSKLDSHWTGYGAAAAWQMLAQALSNLRPGYNFRRIGRVAGTEAVLREGEFSHFAGGAQMEWPVPVLEMPLPAYKCRIGGRETRQQGSRAMDLLEYPAEACSEDPASDLKCLYISDSMGVGLSPYLIASFRHVFFRRHHVTAEGTPFNLPGLIHEVKPDVIVFLLAERYLYIPLGDLDQWEAADTFDLSPAAAALKYDPISPAGLRFHGDPILSKPAFVSISDNRSGPKQRYLRLLLRGLQDGTLMLSYTRHGQVTSHCVAICAGIQEFFFSIPSSVDGEHFWLAAGSPFTFLILEMELR